MPKTHPPLLLRDALAAVFVAAASDADPAALATLDALGRWASSRAVDPALARLADEHGAPLFGADGKLAEAFGELEPYALDRACRFAQAVAWLREEGGLGDPIEAARAAWDTGLFFEVHEILEPVWLRESGARKVALQGLIMAGAALHHLTQSNTAGASGLLREAAARLRGSRPGWPALALEPFVDGLDSLAGAVGRGEVRSIDDVRELPPLERSADTSAAAP